jgi:hypothetical protein
MSQKYQILDNLEDEWEFLHHYIKIQETWWMTFVKPTKKQDIQEDRKWAKDITKLVSVYTKLCIMNAKLREERANHNIKEYTWQKVSSKDKISKKRLQLMKGLDEYYSLKQRFVKENKHF